MVIRSGLRTPRIASASTRRDTVQSEVLPVIEARTVLLTKHEAAQLFHSIDIAAAPVMTPQDILD